MTLHSDTGKLQRPQKPGDVTKSTNSIDLHGMRMLQLPQPLKVELDLPVAKVKRNI